VIASRLSRGALVAGCVLTFVLLLFNIPGNPILELRDHRVAGMVLGHSGVVLLAIGLAPALSRRLPAAVAMKTPRLVMRLGIAVAAVAVVIIAVALAWPSYAHQLLTREWGVVEPLQFTLYLVAARLCFGMAQRSAGGLSSGRLYRLGGWIFRLFALEEVDYLGVPSSVARLAGVEGSRVGQSYVGALHDTLNVAAQYGFIWILLLVLVLAAVGALWWISGGRLATVRDLLSWRALPAAGGVGLMALAQAKDVHDAHFSWARSRLLNDLLEEPLELVAILALNVTLVLELVRLERRARSLTAQLPPDYSATPA
jgi:hypothetical protein